MSSEKKPNEKTTLHPRNKNRGQYDFDALIAISPELSKYIKPNKFGEGSVDFANPAAVKLLNKLLLNYYYGIKHWDFPDENLCPPIPGRADYIHYIADLLTESNFGRLPAGNKITGIDIGTGASGIYPILGVAEYNWKFIGTDIEPRSITSVQNIISSNESLKDKIELRLQKDPKSIFTNVLNADDKIDFSICNPPFHSSAEDARNGNQRKVKNLSGRNEKTPQLNFAGVSNELICDGGEARFILTMINESKKFAENIFWFSTLVSKQSNLKGIYKALNSNKAAQVKTIAMGTGNKSTRIVVWSFLSKEEQNRWRETRWK